jgi:hypothetical protein
MTVVFAKNITVVIARRVATEKSGLSILDCRVGHQSV